MSIPGKLCIDLLGCGNTPLLALHGNSMFLHRPLAAPAGSVRSFRLPFHIPNGNLIILKLEHLAGDNATGSLYDRLYTHLLEEYETARYIRPGETPLVEGSVGNAGAAFARAARCRGYTGYSVLMPADVFPARVQQVENLGARVVFSPPNTAEMGYIEMLEDMLRKAWHGRKRLRGDCARLFPVSKVLRVPNAPYAQLVREATRSLCSLGFPSAIDFFVFGVGAGNTISEVGRSVKRLNRSARVLACEFQENPFVALLMQGKSPPVGGAWPSGQIAETISGVPLNRLNLDLDVIDGVLPISMGERNAGRVFANEDLRLFAGRPTGGILYGVLELARRVYNKTIFSIVFDSVAKYENDYDAVMDIDFANGTAIRQSQMDAGADATVARRGAIGVIGSVETSAVPPLSAFLLQDTPLQAAGSASRGLVTTAQTQ